MLKLGLLGRHLAFLRNQTQPSADQARVWLQLGSDADVIVDIHNSIRRLRQPKEAPYEFSGVKHEVKDRSEGEEAVVDGFFGVKLLCRDSGLNDGREGIERDTVWIYAIL